MEHNIKTVERICSSIWHSGLPEADCKRLELLKKELGTNFGIQYKDNKRHYTIIKDLLYYDENLKVLGLTSLENNREILTSKFALQAMKNERHNNILQMKEDHVVNLGNKPKVKKVRLEHQMLPQ